MKSTQKLASPFGWMSISFSTLVQCVDPMGVTASGNQYGIRLQCKACMGIVDSLQVGQVEAVFALEQVERNA